MAEDLPPVTPDLTRTEIICPALVDNEPLTTALIKLSTEDLRGLAAYLTELVEDAYGT